MHSNYIAGERDESPEDNEEKVLNEKRSSWGRGDMWMMRANCSFAYITTQIALFMIV
jgi:hypothetical protein